MKKDELEKQYRLTLNSIKDIIDDFRNGSIEPAEDDLISSYDEIIDNISEIVNNALDKSKSQFEDFIDEQTSKTICRVVPLEPGARANYVKEKIRISRIISRRRHTHKRRFFVSLYKRVSRR